MSNMNRYFYTKPVITGTRISYPVLHPLQKFIQSITPRDNFTLYLLELLQDNPDNKIIRRCWECYLMNRTLTVVKNQYHRLSGYLERHKTLEDLFNFTFALVYLKFIQEGRWQFRIPSPQMIRYSFKEVITTEINPYMGKTDLGVAVNSTRSRWLDIATDTHTLNYTLLHQCVTEYRQSEHLPCNKWDEKNFNKIAERYNGLRGEYPTITMRNVREILNNIGHLIRQYYTQLTYLDKRVLVDGKKSDKTITILETISSGDENTIDKIEGDSKREDLYSHILKIILELNQQRKNIVFLRYALRYTQKQVTDLLHIHISTVGHLLEIIFRQFCASYQPGINSSTPEDMVAPIINPTSEAIVFFKDCLSDFYICQINSIINDNLSSTDSLNIEILITQIIDNFQLDLPQESEEKLKNLVKRISNIEP